MKKRRVKRRRSKRLLARALAALSTFVIGIALFITNLYVPLKYFTEFTVKPTVNEEGFLRVTFIDVDFGDSILVEFPDGKTALIDCGNGAYPNNAKILRVLNSYGIDKLDYLVCTSVKSEHCGGISEILKYKEVDCAFIPYCKNKRITDGFYSAVKALEKSNAEIIYSAVGYGIGGGDYFLTFLSPVSHLSQTSEYAGLNTDPNRENVDNASAVLWLSYKGIDFALTSDARPAVFERILKEYEICTEIGQPFCKYLDNEVFLEECDVVTVPGHAGKDNTYAELYDVLAPSSAVISVGKNFADYPSGAAVSDICNYCDPFYTMYDGSVTATVGPQGGFKISADGK